MIITKPALWIYTFAATVRQVAEEIPYLEGLWVACVDEDNGLGMTAPVDSICQNRTYRLETNLQSASFLPLAAARTPAIPERPDAHNLAFLFANHDVIGQITFLAPNDPNDSLQGWRHLDTQWWQSTGERPLPAAVIDEAYVFYALYSGDLDLPAAAKMVMEALPGQEQDPWRATPVYTTDSGAYIWEGACRRGRRVLAILAPEALDKEVTQWAFWTDARRLAPFARCLLHAAKINYEWDVYKNEMAGIRERQATLDDTIDEILQLHQDVEDGKLLEIAPLLTAQNRLSRAQSDATGLLVIMTRIKELHDTLAIAEHNLRSIMAETDSEMKTRDPELFKQEFARAQWLQRQGEYDVRYIEALRERAKEVYGMTALRLEQSRQEAVRRQEKALQDLLDRQQKEAGDREEREKQAERKHREMDLLQTILLGALLVSLDAMHAFQTHLPLPEELHWPLIFTLMAFVFALPTLILRWHENYGPRDYLGGFLFGGCLGWFLARFWWQRYPHELWGKPVSELPASWIGGFSFFVGFFCMVVIKATDVLQEKWRIRQKRRIRHRKGGDRGP